MNSAIAHPSVWFWLAAGIFVGVAATLTFGSLWKRAALRLGQRRSSVTAAISVVAVGIVAMVLYGFLGRPDLISGDTATAAHTATTAMASNNAQSMEAVTQQLADRLARDGGSDGDWELLAQSYDFMGRTEDAMKAREHIVAPTNGAIAPTAESASLLAQANALRVQRKFTEAKAAYTSLIEANAMTADSWADYADVLASSNGATAGSAKLAGQPAQAIDKALALDPNHPKALWLKASFAHEERRYSDALAIWRQLRRVIGNSETDQRIIDANIAEAMALAGATPQSGVVVGVIEIDPALEARAKPGSTLFVYAKDANQKGPPVAVYRTTVTKWPIEFTLDDSMAMMPNRTISSVGTVIVEARISRSGAATSSPGDLQATGTRVDAMSGKSVRLRIDKEVS